MTIKTHQPEALSLMVHESISVSDRVVVAVIFERLTTWTIQSSEGATIVSISEYRQLIGDHTSTDKRIIERLQYLEAFCRNIIKPELQTYVRQEK